MYNRYIPGEHGYVRVREEDSEKEDIRPPVSDENQYTPTREKTQVGGEERKIREDRPQQWNQAGERSAGDKFGGLSRLLSVLKLEDVDHGDLLLFLIVLLLLTDGDELDMVITLGLLLLLGLGDRGEQKNPDSALSGFLRWL